MSKVEIIPENKLPTPWNLYGLATAQADNRVKYVRRNKDYVVVDRTASGFRVMAAKNRQVMDHADVGSQAEADKKAIDFMKGYDGIEKEYNAAIMESAATLSFTEKRGLQKDLTGNTAKLKSGTLGFKEKRALQTANAEIIAKLRGGKALGASDALDLASNAYVAMQTMKNFIGQSQISAVNEASKGEERQHFQEKMVEIAATVSNMPSTYETDGQGDKAIAYLHYFKGGSDWYITEKDKGSPDAAVKGQQLQAFGYTILNGDTQNAEYGYISIEELKSIGAELDFYWNPKTLGQIKGTGDGDGSQLEPQQSQKLTDLLSGKYLNESPDVFLTVVQDVANEIKAVDPVKPAVIAYLDNAKAKGRFTEMELAA